MCTSFTKYKPGWPGERDYLENFQPGQPGIPISRYRDFANCEAWDEFTKPRKNGLNKMAKEKHSKQYKFDYVISAGALENVGFFFTAGPRHRGKSSFLRKRMW